MKLRNALLGTGLLLGSLPMLAQTIYAGEQTIDKQTYKGLFLTLPMDDRTVEREWEQQVKQFGRVNSSRSVYRVTTADVRDVSAEPINLTSQLKGNKKSTTIFVAFDQGGGNFVAPGNGNYTAAESLLKKFADQTLYNEEVRGAENSFNESQKTHQKLVKRGETLVREIESNRKEKERLLRKIDENAKELEQLQKDVETNKTDQTTAQTDIDNQRKNLEAVKAKRQP